jgi:hypothetical protein
MARKLPLTITANKTSSINILRLRIQDARLQIFTYLKTYCHAASVAGMHGIRAY